MSETTVAQSKQRSEDEVKTRKRKKIHWPETVLPPINLWNAPLLEHRYGQSHNHF